MSTEPNSFTNKIIVYSSGNNRENVSLEGWSPELISIMLFAGELYWDGTMTAYSGQPGENIDIQNSFLWISSHGVMAATGHDHETQYSPVTGTSMSAAVLSGAVAELMRRFPQLSAAQIKECLLESSDSCRYPGKGILNLNNAVLYAIFKTQGREDAKSLLKEFNHFKETQATNFLQKTWEKYKSNIKTLSKRPRLRIDLTKPDFKYRNPMYAVLSNKTEPTPLDTSLILGAKELALGFIMAGDHINENLGIRPENTNSGKLNTHTLYARFFDGYHEDFRINTRAQKINILSWIARTKPALQDKNKLEFGIKRLVSCLEDIDTQRLKGELTGNIGDQGYVADLILDMMRIPQDYVTPDYFKKDFEPDGGYMIEVY